MRGIQILAKGLFLGGAFSLAWGLLFYVISGGSTSHGVQAATIMAFSWLLLFPLAVAFLTRSQRVRLWIYTGRIRRPTWRRMGLTGAIWGLLQGSIAFYFERSVGRAALVGAMWAAFFFLFPPLIWWLFRDELTP
jgi:hypothetical protein